jgi:hypothetical protein
LRYLAFESVGQSDKDAALVDSQPGPAGDWITAANGAEGPGKKLRRFSATSIKLLAVCSNDNRSAIHSPK